MIDSTSTPAPTDPSPPDYRELRAPTASGSGFFAPPLSSAAEMMGQNQRRPDGADTAFWSSLKTVAREQLVEDAVRYTRRYRNVPQYDSVGVAQQPIVMAGHQPTLFHPGVWLKNRTLDRIAVAHDWTAINLVIDNDVSAGCAIRVPVFDSRERVVWQSVAYDVSGGGVPYEQAEIRDRERFDHFDVEVRRAISPLVDDPLITPLWHHAREAIARCGFAGCAFAQARHALESDLGWQTLELPLGVAVRGLPFARFVMRLIDEVERFVETYNDAADRYRAWHGIRSSAHPVPNLGRDGDWYELPLWVYGNASPQRRGVWVRRDAKGFRLSDRAGRECLLSSNDSDHAAQQLADAASPEFKVRPRALMTTTFARLVLSDLFLHGIGGGKYDQLADRIITRFFGQTPPAFQVVSGTFRLPGQDRDASLPDVIAGRKQQIRQTVYQGERFLDRDDPVHARLIAEKAKLLDSQPPHGHRAAWHRQLAQLNNTIAEQLSRQRLGWQSELGSAQQRLAEEAILASREHSFCLFPLESLTNQMNTAIDDNLVGHPR